MNKIKSMSGILQFIFFITFLAIPSISFFVWLNAPLTISLGHSVTGLKLNFVPISLEGQVVFSIQTKILGFLIDLIPTLISMGVCYCFIKLFSLYRRGVIFTTKNVGYLRHIGYLILLYQFLSPLHQELMSYLLSQYSRQGHRMIVISFTQTNVALIITAILVLLIAWVMHQGCILQEEQEYTV